MTPGSRLTVLLHHKKLNRWLQPGGHADGNGNLFEVALHEASEVRFVPINEVKQYNNTAPAERMVLKTKRRFSNT